jgi:sugar phosphate isomerase/epimerase
MRGSRRRVLGCAAVVATGAVMLATAGAASAQKPEKVGDGIKTGQMGVQLFNYGGFISNGGGLGANPPAMGVSAACATSTSSDCRWERLERLFAYLASKGATNVELFGHANFPANADTANLVRYRALLDKYGLHAGGWHGDMSEANWDARIAAGKILGVDYLGSGGFPSPGIGSYANSLATAQALNRLGKKSVEAGLGPAYFHNHQDEFINKYVDDGVLKTAFEVVMDHTDSRYVVAEIDVKWSSDALDDVTGTQTAAFINKYTTRVQMLHIKDGINIANPFPASAPHVATGTGEIDFRPIFAAANNRVRYYHQEHDGGSLTDAEISLTNLKGANTASVGTVYGAPTTFNSVPAGTAAADNVTPIVLSNTGDQPLTITNLGISANALDTPVAPASDFAIVSQNCTAAGGGGPLAPNQAPTATDPLVRSSCVVNVGFKPSKTGTTSVARLNITSNSDTATENVLLVGKSTNDSLNPIGGDVPSLLQLSIPTGAGSFGTFVPGVARDYLTQLAATVTATTGDAALSVTDPSTNATGKLVNGTFSLASPFGVRAVGLGDSPLPAYTPVNSDSTPLLLRSWNGPVTNAPLTLGFRQSIGAAEALRAGTYSKTLTFTLSTTTP